MTVPSTGATHPVFRELGRRVAEPVLDHVAVDHDRDGENQVDPEAAPVDLRVVGMRLSVVPVVGVVGVGVHRLLPAGARTNEIVRSAVATSWSGMSATSRSANSRQARSGSRL